MEKCFYHVTIIGNHEKTLTKARVQVRENQFCAYYESMLLFKIGLSNHARLDIRRFGSGIWIHPKVRIVSERIYETMFAWYM